MHVERMEAFLKVILAFIEVVEAADGHLSLLEGQVVLIGCTF
jgi:hypothetical protein